MKHIYYHTRGLKLHVQCNFPQSLGKSVAAQYERNTSMISSKGSPCNIGGNGQHIMGA
jgi:hypothetical protein